MYTTERSRTVVVAAARYPSVATGSYQVGVMCLVYSTGGRATWSHTPTNPNPAASAARATRTRSATVAVSSHGSRSVWVRVWMGSWMPYSREPAGTMDEVAAWLSGAFVMPGIMPSSTIPPAGVT